MGAWSEWMINDAGFSSFLNAVLNQYEIKQPALGIAKLVLDRGEEVLTPRQAYVFEKYVLSEFTMLIRFAHTPTIPRTLHNRR